MDDQMDQDGAAGDPADPLLSIGVFARRSRLSPKALRLYDRRGLLVPAQVDETNGYRWYRTSQLQAARLVVLLRRLDMPLPLVARLLDEPDTGTRLLEQYWDSVEQRVAFQRKLAAQLRIELTGQEGRNPMYEIKERTVGEQRVLTEQGHVLVPDLPDWIGQTMGRLMQAATAAGGPTGAAFIVYHGEVNEDSDGPVEACIPIAPQAPTQASTRIEPAHREVYTRITKAQVAYPQILSAFDATAQWVSDNGRTASASPREIYFTDWDAAGPQDEVCDVAYPI